MPPVSRIAFWGSIGMIAVFAVADETRLGVLVVSSATCIALIGGLFIPLPRFTLERASDVNAAHQSFAELIFGNSQEVVFEVRSTKDFLLTLCWIVAFGSVLLLISPIDFDRTLGWEFPPYVIPILIEAFVASAAASRVAERWFLRRAALVLGAIQAGQSYQFRDKAGERRAVLGSALAPLEPVLYRVTDPDQAATLNSFRFHRLHNNDVELRFREGMECQLGPTQNHVSGWTALWSYARALLVLATVAVLAVAWFTGLCQLAAIVLAVVSLTFSVAGFVTFRHLRFTQRLNLQAEILRERFRNGGTLNGSVISGSASEVEVIARTSNFGMLLAMLIAPFPLIIASLVSTQSVFKRQNDAGYLVGFLLAAIGYALFVLSSRWLRERSLLRYGFIG